MDQSATLVTLRHSLASLRSDLRHSPAAVRTKVLLDLCRENLVMTEQTGRRMKVNKGKTGMKKGEGACFPR